MSEVEQPGPPDQADGQRRDGRSFLIVVGACLAVVLGLALVARGSESAGGPGPVRIPTPSVSTSEACATWAGYWMVESGVDADAETIEGFSNCRQAEDGSWFIPTGPRDPRLPDAPILTPEERERAEPLRQELNEQIEALEAEFPAGLEGWLYGEERGIYSRTARPVTGHLRDGFRISTTRGRYARLTQAFLMGPRYRQLADYAGWIMAERRSSFDQFLADCLREELKYLHAACHGVRDTLSINFPPWPWELSDTLTMELYLAWAVDSGRVPASSEAAAPNLTTTTTTSDSNPPA